MKLATMQDAQTGPLEGFDRALIDLGLDTGNGSLKFATETDSRSTPSYIRLLEPGEIDAPTDGGMCHYIDGDRPDLVGKTWVIGETADTAAAIRLVDEPDRKATYALHLLLGALAMLPPRDEWRLNIVASVHTRSLRDAMREALSGSHAVCFNAAKRCSVVYIDASRIVDEGSGAIALVPGSASGKSLLLDIGHGTIQATYFGPGLKRVAAEVRLDAGVDSLVSLIADSAEFTGRFKDRGNIRVIRNEIVKGRFNYGGFNFRSVYQEKLPQWSEQHLKPLLATVKEWRLSSDRLVAVGGGCLLPGVSSALERHGFVIPSDPITANARGLLYLAQLVRE